MFVMCVSTWLKSYMFALFDCQTQWQGASATSTALLTFLKLCDPAQLYFQNQWQDASATSTAPLSTLCVEEVELRTLAAAQPTRSALDTIR